MPNQLAKGGYEYFTTAQMHPVNPDIRVSKRREFKKFMSGNIVPILKAQIRRMKKQVTVRKPQEKPKIISAPSWNKAYQVSQIKFHDLNRRTTF